MSWYHKSANFYGGCLPSRGASYLVPISLIPPVPHSVCKIISPGHSFNQGFQHPLGIPTSLPRIFAPSQWAALLPTPIPSHTFTAFWWYLLPQVKEGDDAIKYQVFSSATNTKLRTWPVETSSPKDTLTCRNHKTPRLLIFVFLYHYQHDAYMEHRLYLTRKEVKNAVLQPGL